MYNIQYRTSLSNNEESKIALGETIVPPPTNGAGGQNAWNGSLSLGTAWKKVVGRVGEHSEHKVFVKRSR